MKKINLKVNKKTKVVMSVILITVTAGGAMAAYSYNNHLEQLKIEQKTVETYGVSGKEKIFMNGIVLPIKSKKLFVNPEEGILDEIIVSNEQHVKKGEPIFTCKNQDKLKESSELENQLFKKRKELHSTEDEEIRKNISLEIEELKSNIKELKKNIYSTVYAPFSGKVYINDSNEDGNSPVATLDSTEFYVKAQVNERDSYKVQVDQDAEVTTIANKSKYYGTITYISSRPYEGSDTDQSFGFDSNMTKYGINIKLNKQENLKSGLNAQIVVSHGTSDKKIPYGALEMEGDKSYVYKIVDNKAVKTEVKVSSENGDFAFISNGLEEDDTIIKSLAGKNIENGQSVYIDSNGILQ